MRKTILFSVVAVLVLSGCTSKTLPQPSSLTTSITYVPGTDEPPTSEVETYSKITINYSRLDGSFVNRFEKYFKSGEYYRVVSPQILFMAPSIEEVTGVADGEDHFYSVVYDYAPGQPLDSVKSGNYFSDVMVNPENGLSFSFALFGAKNKQPLIVGDKFTIYNGALEFRTSNPYTWIESTGVMLNGAHANELYGNEEMFVTFSFNSDESITCYKNGQLIYYWAANLNPETGPHQYHFIYELVQTVFINVSEDGFHIGTKNDGGTPTYTMSNFSIGNAVNDEQALERYTIDYMNH